MLQLCFLIGIFKQKRQNEVPVPIFMYLGDTTSYMYKRLISLPLNPKRSLFLLGPRQVGKSTLLRQIYPKSFYLDFLKSDEFMRFQEKPSLLRTEYAAQQVEYPIIIDEVQKVPLILDEVHWLIENKHIKFILCG